MSQSAPHPAPKETVKETLISIIIAFAMAFVFRSFVIEAFIIPTGSMAPTLLGAHMRFTGEQTGADWAVTPWYSQGSGGDSEPLATQGTPDSPIEVHDPISGETVRRSGVTTRSGDRILVLKYLYALREPERFDVVVFKNPTDPTVNYIKRLLGLPGEMIALVDGDVFVRTGSEKPAATIEDWKLPGWTIARKPDAVQRRVWQTVFDSAMTPLSAYDPSKALATKGGFVSPWAPVKPELWMKQPGGVLSYRGGDTAVLNWNSQTPFITRQNGPSLNREINDRYWYDELPISLPIFPVSDVRVRAAVVPDTSGMGMTIRLDARAHQFEAVIAGGTATLRVRPTPATSQPEPAWTVVATAPANLEAQAMSSVEFWHVDQSLRVYLNGQLIVRHDYDWSLQDRLRSVTGADLEELDRRQDTTHGNVLADPTIYQKPQIRLEFTGGPFTLRSVALDRDLFYQPAKYPGGPSTGMPALATNPRTTLRLGPDQFFVCGDNSPYSQDGRLWTPPEPWVDELMTRRGMDVHTGIVPRDLMLGKAFFVYFPSLTGGNPIPVPDVGRMRFIR